MRTSSRDRTPMLARLLCVAVAALSCAGCTVAMVRVGTGSDHFGEVTSAWAQPGGGLLFEMDAALGTIGSSPIAVDVPATDLDAAHQNAGAHPLARSTIREPDAEASPRGESIEIGRLVERFEWSAAEAAALRAPDDVSQAVICGGKGSVFRVAHLRRLGGPAGGRVSWSVAVLEMRRSEEGGAWYVWPLLPVTLAVDAAAVAVGVVTVFAPVLGGVGAGVAALPY